MDAAIKRRKVIDIPEDVFRCLSIKASASGTNLKNYIEKLLSKEAEEMDDLEAYRHLSKNDPEGLVSASKEEQIEFRSWMGI